MKRRDFLASGPAALALGPSAIRGRESRPNIIMMIADNLGWRDLGCYGNHDIETPNVDRMAEEGARFTNAFVTAPSCSPSRASIISGQAPHSTGVLGLTHLQPKFQMPCSTRTLPGELAALGYSTAINGKWHVAPYRSTRAYGYERHMGVFSIKDSEPACSYISEHKRGPFYLEMNFMQTHRPSMTGRGHGYRQHPDFPVAPESISVPDYYGIPDWEEIREDLSGYYSQAAWMDRIIGEVMSHLKREGIDENTLVVFVSDNGPMYPGGIGSCRDFGIGTPLVMRWPGGIPGGQVSDGLVSTVDLLPTCLRAAGAATPMEVQGVEVLGMARGEVEEARDEVFAEMTWHVRHTVMRAVRTRDYKYIANLNDTPIGLDMIKNFEWARKVAELPGHDCMDNRPPEELYDLRADPLERNNLADTPGMAAIKRGLAGRVESWRRRTGDPVDM